MAACEAPNHAKVHKGPMYEARYIVVDQRGKELRVCYYCESGWPADAKKGPIPRQ